VCGKGWNLHLSQPGGVDFYRCRLGAQPTRSDASEKTWQAQPGSFEACLSGFRANARDAPWMRALRGLAVALAIEFDLDDEYKDFLDHALDAILEARQVLRFGYVLKYKLGKNGRQARSWTSRLGPCMAELEIAAERLEAVVGFEVLASAARARGLEAASDLAKPELLLQQLDLRDLLAHAMAVARSVGLASQLATAVHLQTQHFLSEARVHHRACQAPTDAANGNQDRDRSNQQGQGGGNWVATFFNWSANLASSLLWGSGGDTGDARVVGGPAPRRFGNE